MPIKLLTLNIEGDRHLDRFLPVVKKLNPDVLCLQEVFEVNLDRIARELQMTTVKFVPTVIAQGENKYRVNPLGNWGIVIMTKLAVKDWQVDRYSSFTDLKVFQLPNDDIRTIIIGTFSDGLIEYKIATTHFTWTPDGEITDVQRQDFARLEPILKRNPELVLCGDFNSPRGKEMFSLFETHFKDNLPREVLTTIDNSLHYAGHLNLQLAVDTIFSTPEYNLSDVQVISGISDHMGVVGVVEKINLA